MIFICIPSVCCASEHDTSQYILMFCWPKFIRSFPLWMHYVTILFTFVTEETWFFFPTTNTIVNPARNWLLLFNVTERGPASRVASTRRQSIIRVISFISIYFRETDFLPSITNRKRIQFHVAEKTPFSALYRKSWKCRRPGYSVCTYACE